MVEFLALRDIKTWAELDDTLATIKTGNILDITCNEDAQRAALALHERHAIFHSAPGETMAEQILFFLGNNAPERTPELASVGQIYP